MNFPERISLVTQVPTGQKDAYGKAIMRDELVPAYATVSMVSTKEATDGVFVVSQVSIRVPVGYAVLPNSAAIVVQSGPLIGRYSVAQVRPSRHHTRYVVTRTTVSA